MLFTIHLQIGAQISYVLAVSRERLCIKNIIRRGGHWLLLRLLKWCSNGQHRARYQSHLPNNDFGQSGDSCEKAKKTNKLYTGFHVTKFIQNPVQL